MNRKTLLRFHYPSKVYQGIDKSQIIWSIVDVFNLFDMGLFLIISSTITLLFVRNDISVFFWCLSLFYLLSVGF